MIVSNNNRDVKDDVKKRLKKPARKVNAHR